MTYQPSSLSISIVVYMPALDILSQTLESVSRAIAVAQARGTLTAATLELIDNSHQPSQQLCDLAESAKAVLISGQGNVGYGRGHNLSLLRSAADFHLVLNPDVILELDAIDGAIRYMMSCRHVIMLAPGMRGEHGFTEHLCKRYPTVLTLALRGLAPVWLKRRFRAKLDDYEMRDLAIDQTQEDILLISGSFMFCRRAPIAAIGGFSDAFFVYFEDFDLSIRASAQGRIAYVPAVQATHFGGHAARKGLRHILLFTHGAWTFFSRHGWKIV